GEVHRRLERAVAIPKQHADVMSALVGSRCVESAVAVEIADRDRDRFASGTAELPRGKARGRKKCRQRAVFQRLDANTTGLTAGRGGKRPHPIPTDGQHARASGDAGPCELVRGQKRWQTSLMREVGAGKFGGEMWRIGESARRPTR